MKKYFCVCLVVFLFVILSGCSDNQSDKSYLQQLNDDAINEMTKIKNGILYDSVEIMGETVYYRKVDVRNLMVGDEIVYMINKNGYGCKRIIDVLIKDDKLYFRVNGMYYDAEPISSDDVLGIKVE